MLSTSRHVEKSGTEELLRSGLVNTSGLPAVPSEILLKIVSYWCCIPLPCGQLFEKFIPMEYLDRSKTLHSLSQTCRRLRSFALPVMWQKIEVGVGRYEEEYAKRLATELLRQLEIVTTRNPSLSQYVREVTVCLDTYAQDTVFPELVRALHMFPNMHSLQIISPDRAVNWSMSQAFAGHTFPIVQLLVLNGLIPSLFKSFPRVQEYYTFGPFGLLSREAPWEDILKNWEGVTWLQGCLVPNKVILAEVTAKFRHLKYLEVEANDLEYELKSDGAIDLLPEPEVLQRLEVFKLVVRSFTNMNTVQAIRKNIQPLLNRIRSDLSLEDLDAIPKDKIVIVAFQNILLCGKFLTSLEDTYRISPSQDTLI